MTATVIVVRHAATQRTDTCVGRSDVPTIVEDDVAARQIIACTASLGARVTRVWSSPSPRCAGPARCVASLLGVAQQVDARLLEIDLGSFEGRRWDELAADPHFGSWVDGWETVGPPGGESARALEARVRLWLGDLDDDVGILVAHAGVARALRVGLGGETWPDAMARPVIHTSLEAVYVFDRSAAAQRLR